MSVKENEETSFSNRDPGGLQLLYWLGILQQYLSGLVQRGLRAGHELLWMSPGNNELPHRHSSALCDHKGSSLFVDRLFGNNRSGGGKDDLWMALSLWVFSGDATQDKDKKVLSQKNVQLQQVCHISWPNATGGVLGG